MKTQDVYLPSRFRRRLTIRFVLTAGFAAGFIAGGILLVVPYQRFDVFKERMTKHAEAFIQLSDGKANLDEFNPIINAASLDGTTTIVVNDTGSTENSKFKLADVPKEITDISGTNSVLKKIDGVDYLIAGGQVPNSPTHARIYMFFSGGDVQDGLVLLRNAVLVAWLILLLCAAAAGNLVARQTLRPIRAASEAARAITEGLLDTRLTNESNDEFGAWARYFNEMTIALQAQFTLLQAANEREKRFTADIAHDLRTPLAGMVTASSLLEAHLPDLPPQARRAAELVIADTHRMRDLVGELFELARLDGEITTIEPESVDVRAMLSSLVGRLDLASAVSIDDIGTDVSIIQSDRLRLERIFTNVLINATRHGGGSASVHVHSERDQILLDIRDNGPGIPTEELDLIFDRFHKVSTSRSDGGAGLGLAIAASNAHILGGSLSASNRHEGGAQFRLTLPKDPSQHQHFGGNGSKPRS